MSRILMLDLLLKQMQDKHVMTIDIVSKVFRELENLASTEKNNSVQSYLLSHNGKKFKGTEHIWKFRLDDSNRILYTYGRYLPFLHDSEWGSLVLLGYSTHDKQGYFAKNHRFENETEFTYVDAYVKELHNTVDASSIDEITPEDLYTIAELLSPSYIRKHAVYIASDDMIANSTSKELDENPLLSQKQADCVDDFINNPRPTLILGGAGTGKTLIAIHILNNYTASDESEDEAAYFTQSSELRQSAEKRYKIISSADDVPDMFLDINEYCLNNLDCSDGMKKLMTYARFSVEVFDNMPVAIKTKCKKYGIDQLTAWLEIRGIIKGQLDHEWKRNEPLSPIRIPGNPNISIYVKDGWFKRLNEDPSRVLLADTPKNTAVRLQSDTSLSETDKKIISFILSYFTSFDSDMIDIGKNAYLALNSENTTLDIEQRKIMWQIYDECYRRYLETNSMYDDNDLARYILKQMRDHPDKIEKFGLIVVDEIQDYTELQILLLHSLLKNGRNIVFAGDANQNVNPTLFDERKLQRLYYDAQKSVPGLNVVFLTGNYRCPKETVEITNSLSEVRREIIARGKEEREQAETSGREGTSPFRLTYSERNIENLLLEMAKYPRTAFLVPDEMSKQEVISIIGAATYKENGVPFIHTVSEIKGMEYAYVVCYDLFGKYIENWNAMLSSEHQKKKTGERYYFNLPYVAMTRTQQHLCIVDKDISLKLESRLKLPVYEDFDSQNMHFKTLDIDTEAWLKAANESEEKGHYQDAADLYVKAGASFKDIRRCRAKAYAEIGNYSAAVQNALVARDMKSIRKFSEQLDERNDVRRLVQIILYFGSLENAALSTSSLVDKLFVSSSEYSEEEITEVRLLCIEQLDNLFNRYMDQTESWISNFDESEDSDQ